MVWTPLQAMNEFPDSESSESDDSGDDGFDDGFYEMEQYKLRIISVIEIQQGNIIALYSAPTAFEPFCLCKVLDIGIATEKFSRCK